MGMFGNVPDRQRNPWQTPGFGDSMRPDNGMGGMAGLDLGQIPDYAGQVQQTIAQMPEEQARPKFFGEGGLGRNIAGTIGDALQQQAGMDPTFAPAMQNKLKQRMEELRAEREEATYQRRLADQRAYAEKNKAPHRWESNDGSLMEMGPDGRAFVRYKDPTPRMQWTPQGLIPIPTADTTQAPEELTDADFLEPGGAGPQTPPTFP